MLRIILQAAFLLILASPSLAQDWVVTRVRGAAEHYASGQWIPLARGAAILDEQKLRTGADGRVSLARGAELIELEPDTQILLHEGAGKMTSVVQSSGVVAVDVERRNVQHFSVQTPFLAAVVKGTRFRVTVTSGSAAVAVERGTVQVQDTVNDLVANVARGQLAEVTAATPLTVEGAGPIGVFTFEGARVVNGTANVPADRNGNAANPALPPAAGGASGHIHRNAAANASGRANAGAHASATAGANTSANAGANASATAGANASATAGANASANAGAPLESAPVDAGGNAAANQNGAGNRENGRD